MPRGVPRSKPSVTSTAPEPIPEPTTEPGSWTPDADDFISLKGKAYLPARRRIQWMRGIPVPHPDWTIDTTIEVFERGKLIRPGRVEGGFAVVRSNIYDETGRLISSGVKSEYSENFPDFLEKAETGAIARAAAVAGYGTESALDLDEGAEAERPADAPVEPRRTAPTVTPSSVAGVEKGGRNAFATSLQVARIAALSNKLKLGTVGMTGVIEGVLGLTVPPLSSDAMESAKELKSFLAARSADELGKLIVALERSEAAE